MSGPGEVATAGGVAGLLVVIGGGLKWAWTVGTTRHDKRLADLEAREGKVAAEREERIDALEAKVGELEAVIHQLMDRMGNLRLANHLLVGEMGRVSPDSPILRQVERLLGPDYPDFIGMRQSAAPDLERLAREAEASLRKGGGDE